MNSKTDLGICLMTLCVQANDVTFPSALNSFYFLSKISELCEKEIAETAEKEVLFHSAGVLHY